MKSITLLQAPTLFSPVLVAAQDYPPCETQTLSPAVPTDNAVALRSYSYCGGTLNAEAYIKNINYDKIVTLYYTDGSNQSTPRSAAGFGYQGDVQSSPGWEVWTSNNPGVSEGGITELLNLTFQAINLGLTFVEQLHTPVISSGPPASTSPIPAPYASPSGFSEDISSFLAADEFLDSSQAGRSKILMFNNIDAKGTASGVVIASPSRQNPDYFYTWVRDASLTMDVVQSFYSAAYDLQIKSQLESLLYKYAAARSHQQLDPTAQTGLGEPKFYVNNSAYSGPWGRPQNDGAATAAITLIGFANAYLDKGGTIDKVREQLFDSGRTLNNAPILRDLQYVAKIWMNPSFDLWEEEQGDHFYTRMVQWRALENGADFATRINRTDVILPLRTAAADIMSTLPSFWDANRKLILYENGPVLHGKSSFIDIAVVLGVLHGYSEGNIYSYSNPQVMASVLKIATSFLIFPVSNTTRDFDGLILGIPIGRYPEDVYDGLSTSGAGNPWYLCTAAMAEYFYRLSKGFLQGRNVYITNTSLPFWNYFAPTADIVADRNYDSSTTQWHELVAALQGWGDAFMRTVKNYTPEGGHLSEEFNRDSGSPQGATDLTWSYAAVLTGAIARSQAMGDTTWLSRLVNKY